MKRARRLYYVPGMISLVVLPIICYCYLIPFHKTERVIEIILMEKYHPENKDKFQYGALRFDSTILSMPENRRTYFQILLNGNNEENLSKLDSFRYRIKIMKQHNDTINGVHLIFGDSAKYGNFVQAINICKEENIIRYAIYTNNIWVIHRNDTKEFLERFKNRKVQRELRNKEELEKKISEMKYTLKDRLTSAKLVWPIFLFLGILSIVSLKRVRKI